MRLQGSEAYRTTSSDAGSVQGVQTLGLHASPECVRQGGGFGELADGVAMNVPVQCPLSPMQFPSAPHTGRRPR